MVRDRFFESMRFYRATVILLAGFMILYLGILIFVPDTWTRIYLTDMIYPFFSLLPAITVGLAARKTLRGSRQLGIAWLLLALAMLFFFLGDLIWAIQEVVLRQNPLFSVGNAFYFLFRLLFLLGVALFPRRHTARVEWIKISLDAGVTILAAALVIFNFLIGPLLAVDGGQSQFIQLIAGVYPIGDVLVLWAVLALIYYNRPDGQNAAPLLLLALCALVFIVADSAYVYQTLKQPNMIFNGYQDLTWVPGLIFYMFAGMLQSQQESGGDSRVADWLRKMKPPAGLSPRINHLPFVWILAAFGLLVWRYSHVLYMSFSSMALCVGILILMVVIRQAITMSENNRLNERLNQALEQVQAQSQVLEKVNTDLRYEIELNQQAQNQLAHEALHDALTGLPNRALLFDRLERAIEYHKRYSNPEFAVLFLDCDYFKVINDSLGHVEGDRLLVKIAGRLTACVRSVDTVARIGGDEFVILLEETGRQNSVTNVADRIQEALREAFDLQGRKTFITASIGIVMKVSAYDKPEDILRDADIAMYHAKARGKARYEIFDPSLRSQAVSRLTIENDLRQALEKHEFELFFQPILLLRQQQVVGFEALVRWRHPQQGLLTPAAFIPIAEETGLIIPLGSWVLQRACQQMSTWQRQYASDILPVVNVNISGKQLLHPGFVRDVERILRETGLAWGTLRLEITESVFLEDSEQAAATFEKLKAMGVDSEIDDFGTGYSSLSYLQNYPVRTIKIDRSFINMIQPDRKSDVIRAIMTLVRDLNLVAIAEGVETDYQMAELNELGCQYAQGFLFFRPLDQAAAEQVLKTSLPPAER